MIDRQLTPPRLGACTRRIAPASFGTKAHRPCHRTSRPHCLVQTLPATTAIIDQPSTYLRMFTARATTITASVRLIADCTSISIFAQRLRGIASVGLNAVAFVKETYR